MNTFLEILLGALIVFVYIKLISFIFKKSVMYMNRKSTDFLAQRLPGWLMVMISSGCIFYYTLPFYPYYIMQTIMYVAMGVCIVSLFLLLVVKNISISIYNKILIKIKKEYDSK
ncbi:hypothetical protein T479_12910 [Lysinibacillus varians]|uniref:Uncharacterized protein n=2 Tax=Lysinibacillus sphaericus TaxID=1421 RepID=A0A2S0JZZ9_LYSSH|nr:hypothetical protein T479_12910 [Lysinibacillus varians]AVK96651.1 hypothetical protein LS41612_10410 [Lysinibacillus sphaericus]